jgi:hypothetical protein
MVVWSVAHSHAHGAGPGQSLTGKERTGRGSDEVVAVGAAIQAGVLAGDVRRIAGRHPTFSGC